MRFIQTIQMAVAVLAVLATAPKASADLQSKEQYSIPQCSIFLTAPCFAAGPNIYFAPHRYFNDVDLGANLDALRCAERAKEYVNWCGTPNLTAISALMLNGRPLIMSSSEGQETYLYNSFVIYKGRLGK